MRYFELICTAYIKQDILFENSFKIIADYINYSFAKDEKLKQLHKNRGFKLYVFGGMLPIEKAGACKKGGTYRFVIRSIDEELIDKLSSLMRQNIENKNFLVVDAFKRYIKQSFISELYSATPVIVSVSDKLQWTFEKDGDIQKLHKQLQDNLEKKYQEFYGEPIKPIQNFVQLLEIKNHKPQTILTKKRNKKDENIKFFGNKFSIVPNEDEVSQKLAFVALACGLGEKNSFGGGFLLSHSLSTASRSLSKGLKI